MPVGGWPSGKAPGFESGKRGPTPLPPATVSRMEERPKRGRRPIGGLGPQGLQVLTDGPFFDLCRLMVEFGDAEERVIPARILSGVKRPAKPQPSVYVVAVPLYLKVGSATRQGLRKATATGRLVGTLPGGSQVERRVRQALSRWAVGYGLFLDTPSGREVLAELGLRPAASDPGHQEAATGPTRPPTALPESG